MKIKLARTTIICVFLMTLGSIQNSFAQESKKSNKIEFKSFSFSAFPLEYFKTKNGGFGSVTLDASLALNENIFSFLINGSQELSILGSESVGYSQYNLMYGREVEIDNKFSAEFHGGLGYFSRSNLNEKSGIGVPVMLKVKYTFRKRFSMGVRLTHNFNSIENILTFGVLFQWDFLKK